VFGCLCFADNPSGAITGKLIKAREKTVVINVPEQNGADAHHIFYVGDKTTVTIDGQPATFADLYFGMRVTVIPQTSNIAKSIDATSPPKKRW
jgi:hypothetical protein